MSWRELTLFVPGLPKAQARAKAFGFNRKTGGIGVRMYDPETSRDWKRTVLDRVAAAAKEAGLPVLEGPVWLELAFDLPRPKSLPKKVFYHVKKPDVDNLAKAVKDAMKGVVYRDDSQVVLLIVSKMYSLQPGVHIDISERGGSNGQR